MVDKFGVCPASICGELHGIHGGINAGRACWVVTGDLCANKMAGIFVSKLKSGCLRCDFFNLVMLDEEKKEEGFSVTLLGMMHVLKRHFKPIPIETRDLRRPRS